MEIGESYDKPVTAGMLREVSHALELKILEAMKSSDNRLSDMKTSVDARLSAMEISIVEMKAAIVEIKAAIVELKGVTKALDSKLFWVIISISPVILCAILAAIIGAIWLKSSGI